MKKLILLLFTFISWATYAQDAKTTTLNPENKKSRFTCQEADMAPDNSKVLLKRNVKIETESLFLKADSAMFDYTNQTLVAYGTKEFIFSGGETVIKENATNTIRYRLNDKTIYVE